MNRLRRNAVSLTLPAISPCSWQGKDSRQTQRVNATRGMGESTPSSQQSQCLGTLATPGESQFSQLLILLFMCIFFFSCILSKYYNFTWDENVVEFVN